MSWKDPKMELSRNREREMRKREIKKSDEHLSVVLVPLYELDEHATVLKIRLSFIRYKPKHLSKSCRIEWLSCNADLYRTSESVKSGPVHR